MAHFKLTWHSSNSQTYEIDLSAPIDIAIPLRFEDRSIRAFGIKSAERTVVSAIKCLDGANPKFTGCSASLITFSPHANCTHTECQRHTSPLEPYISEIPIPAFMPAWLFEAKGVAEDAKDLKSADFDFGDTYILSGDIKAVVLKTRTNPIAMGQNFTSTRPRYLSTELVNMLLASFPNVEHLLVDLPSIDPERDEGLLLAHRTFFDRRPNGTITELCSIDSPVKDGLYMLQLNVGSFEDDAAPSRPSLYRVCNIE